MGNWPFSWLALLRSPSPQTPANLKGPLQEVSSLDPQMPSYASVVPFCNASTNVREPVIIVKPGFRCVLAFEGTVVLPSVPMGQ